MQVSADVSVQVAAVILRTAWIRNEPNLAYCGCYRDVIMDVIMDVNRDVMDVIYGCYGCYRDVAS